LVGEGDGYLEEKHTGLEALTTIWGVIYEFKANLAQQLESQIQGLGQSVNGHASGEGFVFPTTGGDVKLVQRTIFSRANFAK
jgi:hypothetical protein